MNIISNWWKTYKNIHILTSVSEKNLVVLVFQKPPSTKTFISRPPIDDHDEIIENTKSVLWTVQNTLTTVGIHNISTQHLLQDINVDIVTYIDPLKISKKAKCHFAAKLTRYFYKCMQSWHFIFMGRKCGPPICH